MTTDARIFQAQHYLQQNKWLLALQIYNDILADNNEHPDALLGVIRIYTQQGHYEEALEYLDILSEIMPEEEIYLFTAGELYLNIGELDKALKYVHLIEKNRLFAELTYNLSLCYLRGGNSESAIKYLEKTLELNPTFPYVHTILAETYVNLAQFEKAYPHLEAMQDFTEPNLYHIIWCKYYLGIEEFEKAREQIEAGLNNYGEHPELYFIYALYWSSQLEFEKAKEYLQKAIALHPDKRYKFLLDMIQP